MQAKDKQHWHVMNGSDISTSVRTGCNVKWWTLTSKSEADGRYAQHPDVYSCFWLIYAQRMRKACLERRQTCLGSLAFAQGYRPLALQTIKAEINNERCNKTLLNLSTARQRLAMTKVKRIVVVFAACRLMHLDEPKSTTGRSSCLSSKSCVCSEKPF